MALKNIEGFVGDVNRGDLVSFPVEQDNEDQEANCFTGYCINQPSEEDNKSRGYRFCGDQLNLTSTSFIVFPRSSRRKKLSYSLTSGPNQQFCFNENVREYEVIKRKK